MNDTLVEEIENDDLIVSVIDIIKAAPLNVFVQDKLMHVCDDAVLDLLEHRVCQDSLVVQ